MATEVTAEADFNLAFWAAAVKEHHCFQAVTWKWPAARDVLKEGYSDSE
jgi:hypothetical protein